MKSNIYLLIKSLIQGFYKGSILTFCLWSIIISYSHLSNPYLLSIIFNGVINYKIETFNILTSMGNKLLTSYIVVTLITMLLSAVDNFIVRKNK